MKKKYPNNLQVKFKPTAERPRYRDANTGIDTDVKLDWSIERKEAIYLITYFAGNWKLNTGKHRYSTPMVTAVLPTIPGREKMALFAIQCFLDQTWENKELIIVNELQMLVGDWGETKEVLVPEGLSNAAKHNVGDSLACGDYIIRWDDDDIYHPDRMAVQMEGVIGTGALASTLGRRIHWLIDEDIAWVADVNGCGTILYRNEGKSYEEAITGGGSDSNFYQTYYSHLTTRIDNWPGLYIRTWHGKNMSTKKHIKEQMPKGLKPGGRSFNSALLAYFEETAAKFKEATQ